MRNLKTFESHSQNYEVFITWEHGDADFTTDESYKFNTRKEANEFLNFIYELRYLVKSETYSSRVGRTKKKEYFYHFVGGHHQKLENHVNRLEKKYKYDGVVPLDLKYDRGDYYASVNAIYVKVSGEDRNIIWTDALTKPENIVDLPQKGKQFKLSTGNINFHGPNVFGDNLEYTRYNQIFKDLNFDNTGDQNYPEIDVKVVDCGIYTYTLIKDSMWDYIRFEYVILCEVIDDRLDNYLVTTPMKGFDPHFSGKFNKPKYDNIKAFEVY